MRVRVTCGLVGKRARYCVLDRESSHATNCALSRYKVKYGRDLLRKCDLRTSGHGGGENVKPAPRQAGTVQCTSFVNLHSVYMQYSSMYSPKLELLSGQRSPADKATIETMAISLRPGPQHGPRPKPTT